MKHDAKIYLAGHTGLVGSALLRALAKGNFKNVITRSHDELDLRRQYDVWSFFQREQPEYVFLAAARVGGIVANDEFPADFITDNLQIQTNVISAASRWHTRKLLFLGSSCIYPRNCPQPIREEYLMTGPLEPTNSAYAVAKIAGIEMCRAYRKQYGFDAIAVMPTNLYGPNDNYDPEGSHVIPGLIRRFHEAKITGAPSVTCWGTGFVRREFLFSDDLAQACRTLMHSYSGHDLINIGSGEDLAINLLADLIRRTVGYEGEVRWDCSKPDGTPRKLLDSSRLRNVTGWRPLVGLEQGLGIAYKDFLGRNNA
jgi:GDP-L-fucose synthase